MLAAIVAPPMLPLRIVSIQLFSPTPLAVISRQAVIERLPLFHFSFFDRQIQFGRRYFAREIIENVIVTYLHLCVTHVQIT